MPTSPGASSDPLVRLQGQAPTPLNSYGFAPTFPDDIAGGAGRLDRFASGEPWARRSTVPDLEQRWRTFQSPNTRLCRTDSTRGDRCADQPREVVVRADVLARPDRHRGDVFSGQKTVQASAGIRRRVICFRHARRTAPVASNAPR
jgi:hypothetical protein